MSDITIKQGQLYFLDGEYLLCRKIKDGIGTFDVTDKSGSLSGVITNESGNITDYGSRIISQRLNELKMAQGGTADDAAIYCMKLQWFTDRIGKSVFNSETGKEIFIDDLTQAPLSV